MEQILAIAVILLRYFFDPKQVKKREEKKIEREKEELSHEVDEHLRDLDALDLATDIDLLLEN